MHPILAKPIIVMRARGLRWGRCDHKTHSSYSSVSAALVCFLGDESSDEGKCLLFLQQYKRCCFLAVVSTHWAMQLSHGLPS